MRYMADPQQEQVTLFQINRFFKHYLSRLTRVKAFIYCLFIHVIQQKKHKELSEVKSDADLIKNIW